MGRRFSKRPGHSELEPSGNELNHGRIALKTSEPSCLPFRRLNHGAYPLANGVGNTVLKVSQDFVSMPHQRFRSFLHRLQQTAAHPRLQTGKTLFRLIHRAAGIEIAEARHNTEGAARLGIPY